MQGYLRQLKKSRIISKFTRFFVQIQDEKERERPRYQPRIWLKMIIELIDENSFQKFRRGIESFEGKNRHGRVSVIEMRN